MKRLVRRAGERLVGLVLPKVEAGARSPNHGQCCYKKGYACACAGTCTQKDSVC
jgi:hypothetical protein